MSGSLRKLLVAGAVSIASIALIVSAAAATTTPAAGYKQFGGCPHPGEATVATCFRSFVSGGTLEMGNLEIPFEEPFNLSGGITTGGTFVAGAKGGLEAVKQRVPGGVVGLTGLTWLEEFLTPEAQEVFAVIEFAAIPSNPLVDPLSLPVKVHLINSVLGNKCYVGSNASPIKLILTTGTTSPPPPNVPITGLAGETAFTAPSGITDLENGLNVDNVFSAPGANGCFLTLFGFPPIAINGLINAESGLPSPAGSNMTIQAFDNEYVSSALVYP
jgi:hypothetical protein